jgi:hypothetical protein
MKKWGKRKSPSRDAFDALNLNPLDLYKVRNNYYESVAMERTAMAVVSCPAIIPLLIGDHTQTQPLTMPRPILELLHHVRVRFPSWPHQAP